jgi:acylphosphatase
MGFDKTEVLSENGIVVALRLADSELRMEKHRLLIVYTGRVQGVGFRFTSKQLATGFDVTGTVRNLDDGRVELIVEGARQELEEFQAAIRDAGLSRFIKDESVIWGPATGQYRGFEIIR